MQTETTEEENPKKVGWVFKLCGVRYGGEGSACKGASLGLKQGLTGWRGRCLEFIFFSPPRTSLYIAVWTGMVACCCHPRVLGASSSVFVAAGSG